MYPFSTTLRGSDDLKPVFWTFQIFFDPHIHQRRNQSQDSDSLMTDVSPDYDVIKYGYVPIYRVDIYLPKTAV